MTRVLLLALAFALSGCEGVILSSIRQTATRIENCPEKDITIDKPDGSGIVIAHVCGKRRVYQLVWVGHHISHWEDVTPRDEAQKEPEPKTSSR